MGARPAASILALTAWLAMPALLSMPAAAQPAEATGRIPTVTRLVRVFSELEARLAASAVAGDATALAQALDPDFEMRIGSIPGSPIPRDDWIKQQSGIKRQSGIKQQPGAGPSEASDAMSIDQMAVHDFGAVAVVSFRQRGASPQSGGARRDLFVVDCWKRAGDGWKLATRYLSDAAAPPTAGAPPPAIDKRY